MRVCFAVLVLAATQIGAAWAIGAANVDRPGGTFTTVEAASPEACARHCEDDGLCLAWRHVGNTCELKAIAPQEVAAPGVVSGLSSRASDQIRRMTELRALTQIPRPATPTAPAPVFNSLDDTGDENPMANDGDLVLLGGLEPADLRSRLGDAAVR
jgi:hypothetical protein